MIISGHSRTSGIFSRTRQRAARILSATLFITVSFLAATHPEEADSRPVKVSEVADQWVERQIGRGPRKIDSVLNAPNDLIAGRQVSHTMDKILKRISARLNGQVGTVMRPRKSHKFCRAAALKTAAAIASDAKKSRLLRGAASTGVDTLTGARGAAKDLFKYVRGELYKKWEQWSLTQIRKGGAEDYTLSRSVGPCTVHIRVVWIKKTDEYRYFIAGDCNCKEVRCFYGDGKKVKLGRWWIAGGGKVTPKFFQALDGKKKVRFDVGPAKKLDVVARCCGRNRSYTSGPGDSWTGVPPRRGQASGMPGHSTSTTTRPGPRGSGRNGNRGDGRSGNSGSSSTGTTKTPGAGSRTGRDGSRTATGGNVSRTSTGGTKGSNTIAGVPVPGYYQVSVPAVPAGPLCKKDRDALVRKARAARQKAISNQQVSNSFYFQMLSALSEGKPGVTQGTVDAAETSRDKHRKAAIKADRAYEAALKIKVKKCGGKDKQASLPGWDADPAGQRTASTAMPVATTPAVQSLAMSLRFPSHCRSGKRCQMIAVVRNTGTTSYDGTLMLAGQVGGARLGRVDSERGRTACAGRGRGVVCAAAAEGLAPGASVSFTVPAALHTGYGGTANVCFQVASAATAAGNPHLVQFALRNAGFNPGPVDGRIGPATRRAIAAARDAAGLEPGSDADFSLMASLLPGLPGEARGLRACGRIAVKGAPRRIARPAPVYEDEYEDDGSAMRNEMLMQMFAIGLDAAMRHRRHRHHRNHHSYQERY